MPDCLHGFGTASEFSWTSPPYPKMRTSVLRYDGCNRDAERGGHGNEQEDQEARRGARGHRRRMRELAGRGRALRRAARDSRHQAARADHDPVEHGPLLEEGAGRQPGPLRRVLLRARPRVRAAAEGPFDLALDALSPFVPGGGRVTRELAAAAKTGKNARKTGRAGRATNRSKGARHTCAPRQVWLEPDEYAMVMSALNNMYHARLKGRKQRDITIGEHTYTVLIHDFDEYTIIGRRGAQ